MSRKTAKLFYQLLSHLLPRMTTASQIPMKSNCGAVLQEEQLTARVEEGNRWKSIINVAEEINASIIVMGIRNNNNNNNSYYNKASKLLMGSTPIKVMNHSRRSVLIAPLKAE